MHTGSAVDVVVCANAANLIAQAHGHATLRYDSCFVLGAGNVNRRLKAHRRAAALNASEPTPTGARRLHAKASRASAHGVWSGPGCKRAHDDSPVTPCCVSGSPPNLLRRSRLLSPPTVADPAADHAADSVGLSGTTTWRRSAEGPREPAEVGGECRRSSPEAGGGGLGHRRQVG